MPLDQQTLDFLEKSRSKPAPKPAAGGLDEFRAAVEPFRALGFEREEVARFEEIAVPIGDGPDVPVRLYRPEGEEPMPLLVWAHGGSWVRVTVDLLDNHFRVMANRSRCAVAAVDYHLSPESQFPTAIEESYAVAKWLKQRAGSYGVDAGRIAIGGESSGGNIAAATAMVDRDRGEVGFALQVLTIPVLDCTFASPSWQELGSEYLLTQAQLEWAVEQYAPGVDRRDPLLSPLLADSHANLAPALIVTGEFDPLRDEGNTYAALLRDAGVAVKLIEIKGLIHHAIMAPALMDKGKEIVVGVASEAGAALRQPMNQPLFTSIS